MSYMVCVFCASRDGEWRRLYSPDIVTEEHGIVDPVSAYVWVP